jgi:hypothetical protein
VGSPLSRVLLRDDLDLEARESGFHPPEPRELVLGDLAKVFGDAGAASLQQQVHRSPFLADRRSAAVVRACARLTWSLSPHSPAGVIDGLGRLRTLSR